MPDENTDEPEPKKRRRRRKLRIEEIDRFRETYGNTPPAPGPTADAYRIANYTDGLIGASPECDVLAPHWDSGLLWPDENNVQPGDWLWDGGVAGGVLWDGTFHRDLARYNASGDLFWSSYLKPGTAPGMQGGYWLNFGSGWSHLHNDDPAQLLTGASQKLFYDAGPGHWKLVIEATKFVTLEVVNVWTGTKAGGNDPEGAYSRINGLDPLTVIVIGAQ